MKNFAKKAAAFTLCLLCALSMNLSALAVETEADIEKGRELWSAFVATAESALAGESESRFSSLLDVYKHPAFCLRDFPKVSNLSEEEITAMTPYERWLWDCSYVIPCLKVSAGDYDRMCGSLENWFNNAVSTPRHDIEFRGTPEMLAAYDALMEWQYYFFVETGTVYNFITGKTNLEEKYGEEAAAAPAPAEPTAPPESDPVVEQTEDPKEPTSDTATGTPSDAPAAPDDEADAGSAAGALKGSILTIVILVVLVGGLAVILYLKKKKDV